MAKLKIIPTDKKDKKSAKLLSDFLNYEYEQHKEFIRAITTARIVIENSFGIQTPNRLWENIMEIVITKYEPIKK